MRTFLRLVVLLLGLVPWAFRADAQGAAFSCDGSLYQIRQVTTGGVNTSFLYRVDRSTAAYTTTAVNINGTNNNLGILLNALAYNSQDGYMYALSTPGSAGSNANTPVYLYKIGQGGIVRVGGAITVGGTNLAITVATGTFDKTGNYYFTSQNTGGTNDFNLYRIAPTTTTPTAATRVALSQNITMYDVAFNPVDGLLYGSNWVGSLFKIDQSTSPATLTTISTAPTQTTPLAVGTVFFDVAGTMYAYSNGTVGTLNSASFYRVDTSTGAYTTISSIDPASVSDGASCINPGNNIDVTKELTNVVAVNTTTFDISYAVRVRNTYTATLPNVQVSDILKGNVSTSTNVPFPTATSIAIVAPPVVTNYDGATLAANVGYTGLNGGGALLSGGQDLTAGQRALITYTVRVQFGSGAVPTTARNNTAYATSTSNGPNQGYTITSNDILLTPNDLVASDASTNSANFPALSTTQTNGTPDATDAPSPTPVTFAPSISGVVFEDVNYGGGAGRSLGTSQGVGRPGARVELYNSTGAYMGFLTTGADGSYSITGLTAGASYTVRVVSSSVTSSRNTNNATGLVGVQTYRATATAAGTTPDLNRVGGEYPARMEAANGASGTTLASLTPTTGTTAAESIAAVTLSTNGSPVVGISFGYNFDTVVNTNLTGQGSLAQFITNANALGNVASLAQSGSNTAGPLPVGTETSIFMIPSGTAVPGQLASLPSGLNANGVAAINVTTALPVITASNTSIDGTTQTFNIGNTNNTTLGTGGTVGTGTAASTLSTLNGPEVQLKGATTINGITMATNTNNTTVRGLSLYGFNTAIFAGVNNTGTRIEQNVIGTSATAFADPGAGNRTLNEGINLNDSDNGFVTNNLIGFNGGMGVWVETNGNGSNNNSITGNEIRGNAILRNVGNGERLVFDGMELQGNSTGNTVSGNLITANYGHGIDSYGNGIGGNTITGNTISNNGVGVATSTGEEGSGLRVFGATNLTTIANNVLTGNNGSGVLLMGTANNVTISQNVTSGNTRLGIDLLTSGETNLASTAAGTPFWNGNTGTTTNVTLNSTATAGGNGLLNYPVITSATVVGTSLLVQGYAKAGAKIELFIAQANASTAATPNDKFGQGATYLTTLTEGATSGVTDTNTLTSQSYSGTINSVNQGTDTNANGFSFLVPLTTAQQAAIAAGTLLTSTATLGSATSEFSGNVTTTVTAPLTGYVYEDVNYGGGAGRSRATAGTSASTRSGAKVELYDNTGAYVSTSITDANGQYSFSVVPGSYTVRVLNNSVLSSRGQAASTYSGDATNGYLNTLLPVQTYNGTTTRVGGQTPGYTDALANNGSQTLASLTNGTSLPQSIATATVVQAASTNAGADFGFNFDTVVNANDVAVSGNNAQGSLRQFILNSNALGGEASLAQSGSNAAGPLPAGKETSIFMIPDGLAHAGLLAATNGGPVKLLSTSGVAIITPATALPTITGPSTFIDGTTQTFNIGNTNNVTLGTGGAVGTGAAAGTLSTLNGPEVQLTGSPATSSASSFGTGLDIAGTGTGGGVVGLAIYGFGLVGDNDGSGQIRIAAGSITLTSNVIGTAATSFADLGNNVRGVGDGLRFTGGTTATTISNNLIGFNSGKGITTNPGVTNLTITNNEIRGNAIGNSSWDGIDIQGGTTTVTNNLLINNAGVGVDGFNSSGSNRISGNTVVGNGRGTASLAPNETPAIRIYGPSNVVSQNIINDNYGAGVLVQSGASTTISQNAIYGNGAVAALNGAAASGEVGIDLNTTNNVAAGTAPYVTLNSATTTGGNQLINYPILTSATLAGTNLVLKGYAKAGAAIELFLAQANALTTSSTTGNNFGQGKTYLTTVTEGATTGVTDANGGTGQTYGAAGATINGFAQGTDTNANGFTFTIPLTAAQQAQVLAGVKLTATSTLSSTTSEFSGVVSVNTAPVPNTLTNASVPNNSSATVLSPSLSGTANGTFNGGANSISYYTLTSLPASGTLTYNGTVLTSANIAATQIAPALLNTLTYTPATTFTGSVNFGYTATDANGVTSTTNNKGGTVATGPATYTIVVTASADMAASLTGGTTLSPGQPTGYYTATFSNMGPNTANSVTRLVTLPAGATLTTTQQSALTSAYSGTTFTTSGGQVVINFPTATTLANGAISSYRFVFTAPATAGSSTIVATTSTTSSEGANVAANSASLTLNTTAVTDVQATITASAATVAPGATATFTATFTNNGTQAAVGSVAIVQLPLGLTPTTVSGQAGTTSGTTVTYGSVATLNTTTGLLTYPATTLAGSSSTSSAIAFAMPTSGIVTGTASITTTTTESNTTNNVASASIMAGPRFDLATTISGPSTVVAGSPVTLNVTTTNNGPQAIEGAVETVQLPAGLNTTSAPNVFISNGGTYDNTSGKVTFPALGALPSGQTVANTITFLAPTSAFAPSATVTPNTTAAGETNTANNVAYLNGAASSVSLTPSGATTTTANVYAILSTTSTIVAAGTQVTYTGGVGNAGPATASSVTARLQLIPGLGASTLTVGGSGGTLSGTTITYPNGATYNTTTGLLSYAAVPSLPSSSSGTATVVVTVPATVGNNGQLLATMSVASATSDAVPADNVKAIAITVQPASDLTTTIAGPTSAAPGQSVTYTATFTNNGPSTASVTAEAVQLPTDLTAGTLTVGGQAGTLSGTTISFANGATYSTSTGVLTLPALDDDVVGAVQSLSLTFVVPAQSYVVSSTISSATPDSNPANNAASVATAVTPTADVAVAISGPATATIGNPVTYIVATTNNGPGTATGVVPTLQLPTGLTITAAGPSSYTYDANGLLTFPTIGTLQPGVSVENYVTFIMPNATGGQLIGEASLSSTSSDNVASNNTAALITSTSAATTTVADMVTSISPTGTSVMPGSTVVYTVAYRNAGTNSATGVVRTAALPTGLAVSNLQVGGVTGTLTNDLITFTSGPASGATYDVATGLLTFPTVASLPYSPTATSYTISFPAPTSGQLVVFSAATSNTTETNVANNRANSSIAITSTFDLTTNISGPASALTGTQNVYTITTSNNGPSSVSSATQTVTLPAGLTTSTLLVAGQTGTLSGTTIGFSNTGASYNTSSGLLTFAGISNLAPGANSAVSNTITVTMPSGGTLTALASVSTSASGESNTANNSASITTVTSTLSFAPVAQHIVNSLRSPQSNTANALAISPLFATDADGSISNYYIQSLPTSGTLYYNGAALTTLPADGYQVANPALLSFDPANTFAGDVFFTYSATDNNGVTSNTALYTIAVAQDIASTYTAYNAGKGGSDKYVTGDVLAQLTDLNKAAYTSTGIIYNATTGVLQSGAANGLATSGTNAVLATTGPAGNSANTLPAGVSLDPATGRIYVSDASQLANFPSARSYSVFVITTDLNGGINQALATFTLGAYPLPVVLTAFTAQAVLNRDALLSWTTASEKNNDHFELERSFDGAAFAPIATLAGHGTTTAASAYAFTDAGVAAKASGPVYYRLRQVDLDGTATYSPVRSVSFTKEVAAGMRLSLFPNPAQASTQLDLRQLPATGTYQVLLLDATGRTVRTASLAGGLPQPLDVQQLAAGTYHVRVTGLLPDGSAFQQTLRLTKE